MKLVLASGSPRRRDLLSMFGIEFEVVPSGFDESLIDPSGCDVVELVEELALQKALSVAKSFRSDVVDGEGDSGGGSGDERVIVLGGDTVIELDGRVFGKAKSEEELKDMIRALAGKRHRVVTGVAVVDSWSMDSDVRSEISFVSMGDVSDDVLDRYSKLDLWHDKSGGYAIQNDPMGFILGFEGNISNIVGLPFGVTKDLLEGFGFVLGDFDVKELEDRVVRFVKSGVSGDGSGDDSGGRSDDGVVGHYHDHGCGDCKESHECCGCGESDEHGECGECIEH